MIKKEIVHLLLIERSQPVVEKITGLLRNSASGESKSSRFRITHCPSLGEAMAWLREQVPDLILADFSLPVSQGIASIRTLRELAPLAPIVVLSDTENEESALAALRMGAQEYLCKDHLAAGGALERSLGYAMERHRIARELSQSRARYWRIINAITSYLYSVRLENGQAVETSHSAACEAVTGYIPEEFAGCPTLWIDIVPEEDRSMVREQIQRLTAGDKVGSLEHRIIRKDGALRWISNMPVPAYDSEGRLVAYDGVVRDITDRRRAEDELRAAHDLLEKRVEERTADLLIANNALQDEMAHREKIEQEIKRELLVTAALSRLYAPLVSLDSSFEEYARVVLAEAMQLTGSKHGYVATIDPATGSLLSHTHTFMRGKDCCLPENMDKNVFPIGRDGAYPCLWGEALNSRKGLIANSPSRHPVAKGVPAGHVPLVNFLSVPVMLAEELVGQIALANKSEPYTAQDLEAIERLADYYAVAIQLQRNEARMHQAAQAAELASQAKSEFLANMSHDIRTPMNAIIGMISLALKQPVPPKVMEYLKIARYSSNALLGIINDILDFSKIESGKLTIESIEFNLRDILVNLLVMFEESGRGKGLTLKIDMDPEVPELVIGDPLRLGQVLTNLLSNAIKFTSQGGITAAISCKERAARSVRLHFEVRDSGIGIPKEKIDSIFDAFEQADGSTTRKYGGTGLGLTICKKLVQMMGSEITVVSTPGMGSAFCFEMTLPLPAAQDAVSAPANPDFSGKHVLVVDDDEYLVKLIHEILESHGFSVVTATRPSEALRILGEETIPAVRFDLILLDLMLPEQDGISTAKIIRGESRLQDIPIIILTGVGNDLEEQRAIQAGVKAFLRKPVSRTLLLNCINDVLGEAVNGQLPDGRMAEAETCRMLRGKKILLVEDNPVNQMVAQEVLANVGIIVAVANNGREALAMLDEDVAAVLMDIQMPEMDGYEATRAIRQQPRFADLPIIAMTAHAMSGDREKCLAAGMDNYVAKPFEPEKIFAMLVGYVGGSTEKREARTVAEKGLGQEDLLADIHAHLEEVYGFDPEKREAMLKGASEALLEQFGFGETALVQADFERLSRVAHSLKGALGTLGLKDLAGQAERIERQQIRSTDNKGELLRGQFAELRNALAGWLG